MEKEYDVFISYKHPDRAAAIQLKNLLAARSLNVWLDEDELVPGAPFQEGMEKGLRKSRSIAILIGELTISGWQEAELQVALTFQRAEGIRVIPVLLPGVSSATRIPVFLDVNTRVNFDLQLNETRAIDRLYWGITGNKFHPPPPPPPPPSQDDTQEALEDLTGQFDTRPLTLLIGTGLSPGGPGMPLRNCDIAHSLLEQINFIFSKRMALLVPAEVSAQLAAARSGQSIAVEEIAKVVRELEMIEHPHPSLMPPIDIAAMYYGIRAGDVKLEDQIRMLVNAAVDTPSTLRKVVELTRKLLLKGNSYMNRTKQLIVTTSVDLQMERALAQAGVPFTRVVQHWLEPAAVVTSYPIPPRDVVPAAMQRWLLEQATSSSLKLRSNEVLDGKLTPPILYKFCGSVDLPTTCALSSRQLFALARNVLMRHAVPDAISAVLQNTPLLFLGAGILDPDFRTSVETLLVEALKTEHRKYLIGPPPRADATDGYGSMEALLWRQITRMSQKLGIMAVETDTDAFLDLLAEGA